MGGGTQIPTGPAQSERFRIKKAGHVMGVDSQLLRGHADVDPQVLHDSLLFFSEGAGGLVATQVLRQPRVFGAAAHSRVTTDRSMRIPTQARR